MTWWTWIILGLVLLFLEVGLISGFFLFFSGFSGILVGLIVRLGFLQSEWSQWLCFTVFAFVLIILFRKKLMSRLKGRTQKDFKDDLSGEIATCRENILPGALGNVECRGTTWKARNMSDKEMTNGQACKVLVAEGLVLNIVVV
ncbi:MAG: hypothetical protein KDD48_06925 [Bdellovibrionales bacterium]|nr:hypothetical protein [Bdellovibrionales bacterium]